MSNSGETRTTSALEVQGVYNGADTGNRPTDKYDIERSSGVDVKSKTKVTANDSKFVLAA